MQNLVLKRQTDATNLKSKMSVSSSLRADTQGFLKENHTQPQ